MAKICPLLNKDCVEAACMLWVPAENGDATCAFAAISSSLMEMKSKPAVQINNEQNVNN